MGAKITLATLLVASLDVLLVAPAPHHESSQFFNNPCISGDTGPIWNSFSILQALRPAASSAGCGVQSPASPARHPATSATPAPATSATPSTPATPTPGSGEIINHKRLHFQFSRNDYDFLPIREGFKKPGKETFRGGGGGTPLFR